MKTKLYISNYLLNKIRILFLAVIFSSLFTYLAHGQQIPLYSQYYINPFIYNPSMTGSGDRANAFLIHRAQWTGIPDAPVTSALTLDGFLKNKKAGLGISLSDDVKGITERIGAHVSYSYRIKVSENNKLLFGVSFGVIDNRIDFSKTIVKTQDDPFLFNVDQRKTSIDANAGLTFLSGNLELGFAIPQLMANSVQYTNAEDSRIFYNLSRHYMASAKYTFDINKEKNISCYPLILMRAVSNTPLQYDINAVLNWQNIGWVAASYRSNYAIGVNVGIRLNNKISAGYAYDIIKSSLGAYSGTSHEIMFGYTFGSSRKNSKGITNTKMKSKISEENLSNDKIKYKLLKYSNKEGFIDINDLNRLIEKEKNKHKKNERKKSK